MPDKTKLDQAIEWMHRVIHSARLPYQQPAVESLIRNFRNLFLAKGYSTKEIDAITRKLMEMVALCNHPDQSHHE